MASHQSRIAAERRAVRDRRYHLGCVGGPDGSGGPSFGRKGADAEKAFEDGWGHLNTDVEEGRASAALGGKSDAAEPVGKLSLVSGFPGRWVGRPIRPWVTPIQRRPATAATVLSESSVTSRTAIRASRETRTCVPAFSLVCRGVVHCRVTPSWGVVPDGSRRRGVHVVAVVEGS